MPITSPGNDDDTGENHQPTLRKNTAEPVEQTLKQNTVVITAGDCLWNHFGADSARVAAANGISNPNLVRAGTVIHY